MTFSKAVPLAIAASVFLSACATTYTGPLPNLETQGTEERKAEIERFELTEPSFWTAGYFFWQKQNAYTVGSFKPVIESVSSRASETVSNAQTYRIISTAVLALGAAAFLGSYLAEDGSSTRTALQLGGTGAAVASAAFSLAATFSISSAAAKYNEDLKTRLR